MSTTPEVNIRSTTTPDSYSVTPIWLSRYLVVDYPLGTLQALVHIVTVNR